MADFRPGSVSWELPNGISMHMWINTHTTHGQILQLSGTRGYMTGITPSSARTTHFVGQWGALDICRIHARTSSHMKQQGERKNFHTQASWKTTTAGWRVRSGFVFLVACSSNSHFLYKFIIYCLIYFIAKCQEARPLGRTLQKRATNALTIGTIR